VIFMEQTGKLYRLWLNSGELIWKTGGIPKTWTDGCQFVASNGLVYAVAVDQFKGCPKTEGSGLAPGVDICPGIVAAYKISDGSEVFKVSVSKPPNTAPVVGRLGKDDRLSLVMPIGQQTGGCESPALITIRETPLSHLPDYLKYHWVAPFLHYVFVKFGDELNWLYTQPSPLDVVAFDAETGKHLWTFLAEIDNFVMAPGDRDGLYARSVAGIRPISCPTPWAAPRIGSDGTIYVGSQNGNFYAIRDANGDNHIDSNKEVSIYETKGVFTHIGSAHAPGMIVAVNFDSVFVFKS